MKIDKKLLPLKKREWIYVMPPAEYEIDCDRCNGTNIAWSEFVHMIWCYDCKVDTEGFAGVFSGPIPIQAAELLGMSFDRIRLKDQKLLKFNPDTLSYSPVIDEAVEQRDK